MKKLIVSLVFAAGLTSLVSCNIFDPVDSASGDAQLLSAARACFDKGDFTCARDHYAKLSPSENDAKIADQAFLALDENGASMGVFLGAFGKGANVSALNKVVGSLSATASSTKRLAIYNNAYAPAAGIQNAQLRALVQFIASVTLAAEVLAEASGADGKLSASELATGPAACKAASTAIGVCGTTTECGAPGSGTGSNLAMSETTYTDLDSGAPSGANPDLYYFNASVTKASSSLSALGVSGSFGATSTSITAITSIIGQAAGAALSRCYRQGLLNQGIGE